MIKIMVTLIAAFLIATIGASAEKPPPPSMWRPPFEDLVRKISVDRVDVGHEDVGVVAGVIDGESCLAASLVGIKN